MKTINELIEILSIDEKESSTQYRKETARIAKEFLMKVNPDSENLKDRDSMKEMLSYLNLDKDRLLDVSKMIHILNVTDIKKSNKKRNIKLTRTKNSK